MVDWFEKPENKWLPAEVGHNIFKKAKQKMDSSVTRHFRFHRLQEIIKKSVGI